MKYIKKYENNKYTFNKDLLKLSNHIKDFLHNYIICNIIYDNNYIRFYRYNAVNHKMFYFNLVEIFFKLVDYNEFDEMISRYFEFQITYGYVHNSETLKLIDFINSIMKKYDKNGHIEFYSIDNIIEDISIEKYNISQSMETYNL